ncbi:MAG: SulP family inorganic anion transporter [Flavobacteriales bacterium]|jgi:MFS superfamily sulfate permease-like transporter
MSKKSFVNILSNAGSDISASIVVFLVALPLCLGVAVASDAQPFAGIIAGIVGGIIVGFLSGSHVSVSGPAAGLTVIVSGAIAGSPSYEVFLAAIVVAGFIQLALGFIKAGVIGEYIPASVIKGMLAAIGLILILKQIPHFFGDDAVPEGDEEFIQSDGQNTFSEILTAISDPTPLAMVIGIISVAILLLWDTSFFKKNKILSFIPGSLVVVALGIGISEWVNLNMPTYSLAANHLVNIPVSENLKDFGSFFSFPDFSHILSLSQIKIIFTLAIVASLESLLSIEAADKIDPMKRFTPPNRELVAQGIGNIVSGGIGGLPVTAVIVRSSANVSAGAKTKLSAILHGVLLLICVYFVPEFLNKIPLSSLAAILILVGYKLTKPAIFKEFYDKGKNQIIPFIVTIVAILLTDLLIGIMIGIATGLIFVIKSNFKNSMTFIVDDKKYLIRFRGNASFLNKPKLKTALASIENGSLVFIDVSKADFVDSDIRELILDFEKQCSFRNIDINISFPEKSNG